MSTTVPELQNENGTREDDAQSSNVASSNQGYILPEGKIMPNTLFVGGIDIMMDANEIRDFFARYGVVKEVKIITDRTGISKGYGFISFHDDVDIQKIVEMQINFKGKKLKLGPAIRKQQHFTTNHVHQRPVVFSPPPPQFPYLFGGQSAETHLQPQAVVNPVAQYVQAYPFYNPQTVVLQQVPLGYQQPACTYQLAPPWTSGDQRNWIVPQAYTGTVNFQRTDMDTRAELSQTECIVHDPNPSSTDHSPQKKAVDRSIQTVISCLFSPEGKHRSSCVASQDDFLKVKREHQFRRSRTMYK
uniref:Deleted in azoospermia like n=1 Tax=Latimeria chalumnae TaxID=7897 RepID=H3A0R7_LATCH|nr:PREDICTED: deleted in azoospermia-like isoform X1 [Latimeria chalumnae]|eukprot:XP_014347973.1 PREDICTED: deleted in azoospermia-like isoform X1 [Latimeria chalumnae]